MDAAFKSIEGQPERDRRGNVCLFAHFDPDDVVDPYVHRYLESIRLVGFDIVFISASKLSAAETAEVARYCDDVVLRENVGLDFGSWSDGYHRWKGRISGNLLLANDSVYGPLGDLAEALRRLTAQEGDFYGMVESLDVKPHVQSWFLLLKPHVYRHAAFARVMAQDFAGMGKNDIIRVGEISLSATLRAAGFRSRAMVESTHLGTSWPFAKSNAAHYLWRELIAIEKIPFMKVELLRDNPVGISQLHEWRTYVADRAPELVPLIDNHLRRVTSNGSMRADADDIPARWWSIETFVRRQYKLSRSPVRRFINIFFFFIMPVLAYST